MCLITDITISKTHIINYKQIMSHEMVLVTISYTMLSTVTLYNNINYYIYVN